VTCVHAFQIGRIEKAWKEEEEEEEVGLSIPYFTVHQSCQTS